MKNCKNCANKGTVKCEDCKAGNPPTMWEKGEANAKASS